MVHIVKWSEVGQTTLVATHTTSFVAELGRGNTERLTMTNERNTQKGRIVSIASEIHAIGKEIQKSKLITIH